SSTTVAKPTFIAPEVTVNTSYTFTLVVNNGTVDSPADMVVITVANVDKAPYVKDPIKDVLVDKGAPVLLIDLKTVFADDDVSDVLSYSVSSNSNVQVVTAIITNSILTLSFSTLNTGIAEITIIASSNGKEVQSTFGVEVKLPTGINLLSDDTDVQVYPNPTSGNVQLKFSNTPEAGTWITVYNILGKIISKSIADNKVEYLNLKGNPAGSYFIRIDRKSPKTYKLVLE
ncbi:MAG: T9SS type A sorting domain-containing protein, partial [Bacteroidota bacterium]|nr:T9SS type A sorting domain-containing protein [Bacteroidota bacterium]